MPYHAHPGEPLAEHLVNVAKRSASHARAWGAQDEAYFAGLLHDIGKYSALFSRRLQGLEQGLDHWSPGAWLAVVTARTLGLASALAVQGHHIGLQAADADSFRSLRPDHLAPNHPLGLRLTEQDPHLLVKHLQQDGLTLPTVTSTVFDLASPAVAGMLDVRMLYSALVDADFIETEAWFARDERGDRRYRQAGPHLEPELAIEALDEALARLRARDQAAPGIASIRSDLMAACVEAASRPRGVFTLTAPTGSGKTLSMLAFALHHARMHGMRRVVVVIPYLSIIEQTARVYREVFWTRMGPHYVLEHHSLSEAVGSHEGDDASVSQARLLSENWDAPVIVTTSVQLLESLFSNRPAACRKLHRLAESVVLLDEVQTLPTRLAIPTLAGLSQLPRRFGSTVVMATATQPAFDHLDRAVASLNGEGWRPREIVPPALGLFQRCRRTVVRWEDEDTVTWEALAERLSEHPQVLCVVNLKRHAVELVEALRAQSAPGVVHLSTNMCPAHRERVLREVRDRLDGGQPCVLVSTQCVEAGVDLDFPVVFRAFGPLDSIAQAAGRCNRNGRLQKAGTVVVFRPEDEAYPRGGYDQAAAVTRALLRAEATKTLDIDSPEVFDQFYRTLYDLSHLGRAGDAHSKELLGAIERRDFVETSRRYRLIDQDTVNLVVAFDLAIYRELREELQSGGYLGRTWIRRARPFTLGVYRPRPQDPIIAFFGSVPVGRGQISEDWFIHLDPDGYDRDLLGLRQAPDVWIA